MKNLFPSILQHTFVLLATDTLPVLIDLVVEALLAEVRTCAACRRHINIAYPPLKC